MIASTEVPKKPRNKARHQVDERRAQKPVRHPPNRGGEPSSASAFDVVITCWGEMAKLIATKESVATHMTPSVTRSIRCEPPVLESITPLPPNALLPSTEQ